MELVDVANDALLCGHGLVVHVRSSQWSGGKRDLVTVPLPGVGDARKRADLWRTSQRTRPADVLLLYRRRRLNSVLRNDPGERPLCDGTWHPVGDDFRRSRVAHSKYQECGSSVADCAESYRDGRAARTVGLERLSADSIQRLLGVRVFWCISDVARLHSFRARNSKHLERGSFGLDPVGTDSGTGLGLHRLASSRNVRTSALVDLAWRFAYYSWARESLRSGLDPSLADGKTP